MSNILERSLIAWFFLIFGAFKFANKCCAQGLPIKPVRTISFTTNEGSYMNVDVSPDGKTLAFDLLGDLYTMPSTGGEAKQLTRGIALHLRPLWSSNGKNIAYLSDITGRMQLNVLNLSTASSIVLPSGGYNPVWTPDSRFIVETTTAYSLTGGQVSSDFKMDRVIRFSADGKLVYGIDSNRLVVYDMVTDEKRPISNELRNFLSGELSSDSRWWCYISESDSVRSLIAEDLVNDERRVLVASLIQTDANYLPSIHAQHFSFSPDSRSVYISYGGKIHRISVVSGGDAIIPFTAKVKSDLGAMDYHKFHISYDSLITRYIRSARRSPDGRHLVFTALSRIYIMDLPHGNPHPLIPQSAGQFQPTYSPDGHWIAFVTWCDTIGGFLWRVPASGGVPEQLTSVSGQYQRPTWSPDGKQIAVIKGTLRQLNARDETETGQLELISVRDKNLKLIDDSVPLVNQLSFSSDGSKVYYKPKFRDWTAGASEPYQRLVSKDLSNGQLQAIAVGNNATVFQEDVISPDGRFVICSNLEDLYLFPLCQLTHIFNVDLHDHNPVIRFAAGADPYWEKGGKVLTWISGNKFYEVNPDKICAAAEKIGVEKMESVNGKDDWVDVDIHPDTSITLKVKAPMLYAHGIVVLRGERIVTMGKGGVIERGAIVINNARIAFIGPMSAIRIPAGAKIIDLSGKTIMPGMIDLHLHMRTPKEVLPQQSWMFLANLAYGVTTARDPFSTPLEAYGYMELLQAGLMTGSRLFPSGGGVRGGDGISRLDNIQDAIRFVRQRAIFGGTFIKDYLPGSFRLEREWVLLASQLAGLSATNEGDDPIFDLGMIKDGYTGIEHNRCWGDVYKDFTSYFALSGVYFTPTLLISAIFKDRPTESLGKEYFKYKYWHQPNEKLKRFTFSDPVMESRLNWSESWEAILKATPADSLNPLVRIPATIDAQIRHRGGKVGLGSHGEDEGIGAHNELWALQLGGLTNMEALQAATIIGAEALGIQKDVGSLEVGKIADLIVLNKNPLEDIHNSREIKYVMKDGILYDGDTLDELWPIYKKCPEWKLKARD